eukprot:12870357-Heterocapsa_arctica.AAC.1
MREEAAEVSRHPGSDGGGEGAIARRVVPDEEGGDNGHCWPICVAERECDPGAHGAKPVCPPSRGNPERSRMLNDADVMEAPVNRE